MYSPQLPSRGFFNKTPFYQFKLISHWHKQSSPFGCIFFLFKKHDFPPLHLCCSCHQECHLPYLLLLLECLFSRKLFLSLLVHMVLLLSFNFPLFWFLLTSLFLCFSVSLTFSCILKHIGSFSTKLCLFIVHFCTIQISRNTKSTTDVQEKK